MTELKITQADREAAAAYYYSAGGSPKIANEIREGKKDGWFRVQAFARHRIAAEEGKAELVEAAEALLHAVCGETGFAAAVRADSGVAYPWPALDIAEADLRAALARVRGEG